mmetsp:Transcript_16513/g.24365  ORF Transcript_16513/g.24365 Transcript_16513/m.24365 type:complete len:629 (-) Transcript_16513:325-2211(-)|eukprot:CAMPEP_0116018460 /NCGR_PEP_ID=MMETSP0321-20121206/8660_1 /TAXON_ID=163516 /ORGANISM="Leptocylindrus danicus var. danicus, Strain B650" /LENGTH=628 /DNA_ID=CAMNT_0003488855 /DNA_START=427 /DNA_END=2313 /DNA_ORIENTATION=-
MVKALTAPIALALLYPTSTSTTSAYSTGTIHSRPNYRLDDAFFHQQQPADAYFKTSKQQLQPQEHAASASASAENEAIPPWLRHNAEDAPARVAALQTALSKNNHLSLHEREDVMKAVHMAADHDMKKLAGASEFLVGILSNLELLGRDTLIAAAFHYCSCVSVREKYGYNMHSMKEKLADEAYRKSLEGSGVECFGSSCLQIALSAARMKRAEVLAVYKKGDLQQMANLRNLLLSVTEDWRALAIRSYASLYRLQYCSDESKYKHMAKEALRVYAPLSQRLGFYILKSSLEDCAFHILYPRQYRHVSEILHRKRDGLHAVHASATENVKRILGEDVDFMAHIDSMEITARIKEPYSMWRKILKNKCSHDATQDAVAMRVVLSGKKQEGEDEEVTRARERALCYYAQELCMQNYAAVTGRVKDYISSPKKNGYQSLHYTANMRWHGEEWPFEIQVRSHEMHRVAEYGVAAHWDYKMPQSPNNVMSKEDMYHKVYDEYFGQRGLKYKNPFEQQMGETPTRLAPYLQAMSTEHRDQARDHVFVFLREDSDGCDNGESNRGYINGRILSLPAGACVIDALRQEGEHGSNLDLWSSRLETNIYHNGSSLKSMTDRLSNGDVLTVPSTCSVFA